MTPQALGTGLDIALELRFDQAVHEADVLVDETTMNNDDAGGVGGEEAHRGGATSQPADESGQTAGDA